MLKLALALAALLLPAAAHAQAYQCAIPEELPRPRADNPTADQPVRRIATGGYTLALTWAPQYCRNNGRTASARFQCASGNRFGFTLHGLWPDGVRKEWPQYCRPARLLSEAVVRRNLCATPSVQLLQHEWAKHGTCMTRDPDAYFGMATRLYRDVRYPDMDRLSRRPLTVGAFAAAFAKSNPGLRPNMIRITTTRGGWLDEVWLCLDKRRRYARCPAHQQGAAPGTALKIWRGGR